MIRTKAEWRRALLTARAAIPEAARRHGSAAMLQHVQRLPCFETARSILGYVALGAEADPFSVLSSRVASGIPVFMPSITSDGGPCWLAWNGRSSGEIKGGVLPARLEYPVLAIVPGVGFDVRGIRLGRGRGFYDRALAELRGQGAVHAVGLAFECQIVRDLPSDVWDECVDFVASEKRILAADTQTTRGEEGRARWS